MNGCLLINSVREREKNVRACVRERMHAYLCVYVREREIERKYECVREDERMCVSDSVNCVSVLSERKRLCVNDRA